MEHFEEKNIKSIFLLSKFGLEKNKGGAVDVSWGGGQSKVDVSLIFERGFVSLSVCSEF